MNAHSVSHLADSAVIGRVRELVARGNRITGELLVYLAEAEARSLYLAAGYPSMLAYCVGELHLSEDAACDRLDAARLARQFPAFFTAVAEGRLHLSAVLMLRRYLTPENADDLIRAATHQSKSQILQLLANRFPRPDVPTQVRTLAPPPCSNGQLAPDAEGLSVPERMPVLSVPERIAPRPKVTPLAPERFAYQFTASQNWHDKLDRMRALSGHRIPSGDVVRVLEYALDLAIAQLEKRKLAATSKPRPARRPRPGSRTIPADVKRRVRERDGDRCAFVGDEGQRCLARGRLEFDHIQGVARGGKSTVDNVRLLCQGHNQYTAERTFGAGFMDRKRGESRRKTAEACAEKERARAAEADQARTQAAAETEARAQAAAAAEYARAKANEVIPWLRSLKFSADEARRAAAHCEAIPDAPIEERVRVALSLSNPRARAHASSRSQLFSGSSSGVNDSR